jgi:hypothetical protein
MQDLPVSFGGYRCTVVEAPAPKLREDGSFATDRDGVTQFVVSLFVRMIPGQPGMRVPKGEEIRVTLGTDPGPGFEEDTRVELIDARVNAYQVENGGRVSSGLWFKAMGLKPFTSGAPTPAPRHGGDER